ncbi:hypothetical protein SLEP1_g3129 [Rubroshorea leprosula]|uniref:DNA-binding protein BIN4 n=1 Tax=Rubroshorea leprosula TaxID=152421 RepID=A0AAV5HQ52_9ROSI|nr:hypothetical protein SLEP1_g3129 [Rubroshorea leprosula]
MSSSREDSPDWLRSFQAPSSHLTLSSDSDPLLNDSPRREDNSDLEDQLPISSLGFNRSSENPDTAISESGSASHSGKSLKAKSPKSKMKVERTLSKKKKKENSKKSEGNANVEKVAIEVTSEEPMEPCAANHSIWTLSSDSESPPDSSLKKDKINSPPQTQGSEEAKDPVPTGTSEDYPLKKSSKGKSPKKGLKEAGNDEDTEIVVEETAQKHIEPQVSTSRLPLVLPEKVHRSKALVECEGDSVDLSGDVGAVGRVVIPDPSSENHEMFFDLKGTIYKTTIVPSRTFCIVSFGQSEAKIEAIMNDFIQLRPQSNVYEAETMVEGTLDGFLFDSEDEADKVPKANQAEGIEEQADGKTKGKAEKASAVARKRGKAAGGKLQPPKKARKKTVGSKKPKTKK